MCKSFLSITTVILFGIIAGFSLLHGGLMPTHDGEYHVVRFFLFNESLDDGNLYPRWASHLNNGFGAPLFNFVYPLPNYIASFLHYFGVSFIDSFRFEMFAAIITGAVFFYLWAREFWGKLGGVISSIFYTFSPYHFVDIYIRGSVGEVWAIAFFPAFLWTYTRFARSRQKIFMVLSSIFLALIIFSHNILALMFFFFSLSYIIFMVYMEKNKKHLLINTSFLILLGLGLSAVFWLPAIYETRYAVGLQIFDISAHFPDLYKLLIPSWGSGFSGNGLQNELSFQVGIANLFAIFTSLVILIIKLINKSKKWLIMGFFLLWFLFVLLLMLDISKPVWKAVPFMNYFQFPWRLLSIEILFASFLAGSIFSLKINMWLKNFIAVFLILLVFVFGIGYAKPAYYHDRDDNYYISRSNFMEGTNSPGNVFNTIYLRSIPAKEKERLVFAEGNGEFFLNKEKSNYYDFAVNSHANSQLIANLAYFPGWEVYVNEKKVPISLTKDGRFNFFVPGGENKVEIIFGDTFVRKIAAIISIVSFVFMVTLLINKRFVTINR
ncbi:MAG: 6-pyruvoyl-tetrahydropterin synthase-related protein [Candidatus Levybacteria bacterium]|nr:6-pyruvoyl-tetrahydropterin synthase-related protein [Candidatus Levybacteria bacterium]